MAFNSPRKRACGTWPSPITAQAVSEAVTTVDDVIVDTVTRKFYHIEKRPSQGSRRVLVSSNGADIVDRQFDVKTVVNNHSGGAAASIRDNVLYFNNANDHRVYRQSLPSINAIPITPANEPHRFAFFARHPVQTNIIFTVKEDHTDSSAHGIVNTLAYIDARRAAVYELVSGSHFYVNPTVNANGTKLAWLEWNHPHMPWTGAQLYIADIIFHGSDTVSLANQQLIAGDPGQNAVFQFIWCPPDYSTDMVIAWDKTPFAEPWIYTSGGQGSQRLKAIFAQPNSLQCDFADPAWGLNESSFLFLDDTGFMLWVTTKEGRSHLNYLNLYTGDFQLLVPDPFLAITRVQRVDDSTVVFIGTTATRSASVIRMSIDRKWSTPAPSFDVIFAPPESPVELGMIPIPKLYKIPKRNGQFTYAQFYPPANSSYAPLEDEKPPCILSLHTGPTTRSAIGFQLFRTYYTSRGFSWLDVDFCGSTGYGKEYRSRLQGNYGVLDVEDVVAATQYLSLSSIFDSSRVCLRATLGACFPVLQLLTMNADYYVGAATHFMIVDLATAARNIRDKPTMYYLPSLMGGTPDEIPEVYRARNPILNADRITRPLLVIHAQKWPTVSEAEDVVNAILQKRGQVEYHFLDAGPTMYQQLYEHELAFFQRILT